MQLGQDLVNILTPSMQRRKKESIQKHVADLQANIHTWRVFFLADVCRRNAECRAVWAPTDTCRCNAYSVLRPLPCVTLAPIWISRSQDELLIE